jgi:hypothetical protein
MGRLLHSLILSSRRRSVFICNVEMRAICDKPWPPVCRTCHRQSGARIQNRTRANSTASSIESVVWNPFMSGPLTRDCPCLATRYPSRCVASTAAVTTQSIPHKVTNRKKYPPAAMQIAARSPRMLPSIETAPAVPLGTRARVVSKTGLVPYNWPSSVAVVSQSDYECEHDHAMVRREQCCDCGQEGRDSFSPYMTARPHAPIRLGDSSKFFPRVTYSGK